MKPIDKLYENYLNGTITDAEKKELFDRIRKSGDANLQQLAERYLSQEPPEDLSQIQGKTDQIFEKIKQQIDINEQPKKRMLWQWLPYVAAILVAATVTLFIINQRIAKKQLIQNTAQLLGEDIPAGTNRATLRLANGKSISLDDAQLGQLALEQGVKVTKTADGQLLYEVLENTQHSAVFNSISTPNGGKYTIKLPDGSTVYLNAASQLKYPTQFDGAERRVELSGEAYFEVAKDSRRPFLVKTSTQLVQVLGTHFNVNSYQDEGETTTTLAEGSVKVSTASGTKVLKPGQQTIVTAKSIALRQADLETALAWKNGRIEYKDASIETIMADVSRWYDLEVHYEGVLPDRRFVASIPRTSNLSSLLTVLKLSDINFEIRLKGNQKQLIVKP